MTDYDDNALQQGVTHYEQIGYVWDSEDAIGSTTTALTSFRTELIDLCSRLDLSDNDRTIVVSHVSDLNKWQPIEYKSPFLYLLGYMLYKYSWDHITKLLKDDPPHIEDVIRYTRWWKWHI